MYLNMYVCMYVNMYICIFVYSYVCKYVYMPVLRRCVRERPGADVRIYVCIIYVYM